MLIDYFLFSRYYAILYPMKAKYICTKDRTRRVIGLLWVMSFALATPIIYGQVRYKFIFIEHYSQKAKQILVWLVFFD